MWICLFYHLTGTNAVTVNAAVAAFTLSATKQPVSVEVSPFLLYSRSDLMILQFNLLTHLNSMVEGCLE